MTWPEAFYYSVLTICLTVAFWRVLQWFKTWQ